jgi:pseudaminic acid cytidylyltransferase
MRLAVIPARGGSKRIPRKNIKMFGGKPMIAWSIEAVIASELFDHIIVSTDDSEIAEVAKALGAEVPFMRPLELSDDYTPTAPVIAHAIQACADLGWRVDLVCCIYPVAPFIQVDDIKGVLEMLENTGADYCFPVTEFHSPIQRALRRDDNGRMSLFYPQFELIRTQDIEPAYHDAGQFYWGTKNAWLTNANIHGDSAGYCIPNWRVVDIDTTEDWQRAEMVSQALNLKK